VIGVETQTIIKASAVMIFTCAGKR
jgi:hypothetical protein